VLNERLSEAALDVVLASPKQAFGSDKVFVQEVFVDELDHPIAVFFHDSGSDISRDQVFVETGDSARESVHSSIVLQ